MARVIWKIFLCQIIHTGNNAAGGHRNISLADVQPVFIRQHTDKFQKIVIIIQRFPGSHNHYIGNPLPGKLLYPVNLSKHFRRQQIPAQPPMVEAQNLQPILQPT